MRYRPVELLMSTVAPPKPLDTFADVLECVGVPANRVLYRPYPATEAELLAENEGGHLCELVDGVLVEKTMGYYESIVAAVLIELLGAYVRQQRLGSVMGEAGLLRLVPGLVRAPDVSFVSWKQFHDRLLPRVRVLARAPDLAVEVLSEGNTPGEMERKLREYFDAGTRLVWYADPLARTVRVFTSPEDVVVLGEDGGLDGADVVPGFQLRVAEWFDGAGPLAP
jgi:Uma2 family endonuclease